MTTLHSFFLAHPKLAIAFSGGLDSRFLCASALAARADVLAIHVTGPHIPEEESRGARAFAATMGLSLLEMELDPLVLPEIAHTDPLRCYHCKKFMLQSMRTLLRTRNEGDRILCDGSNADDRSAYRPGMRALEEEHVLSPLAMASLTKAQIREGALAMGFPLPQEQARPCLLTRYDYHLPVHKDELQRLALAEKDLLCLQDEAGKPLFADLRLRLTPSPVLQTLHFEKAWLPATTAVLARYGFAPFTVIVTPTISGYYDKAHTRAQDSGR